MKRLFTLALSILVFTGLSGPVAAAPIAVPNSSMETPVLGAGAWTNALTNWTGTAGASNGQAFIEYIANFSAQGTQHLGMELNYDVWQDITGVTYEAASEYTLTVAVGNRTGNTQATNDSQYA